MHFLLKILRGISDEAVHHAFLRFGRGDYEGPAAEISVSRSGNVKVRSTYQYQDLVATTFLRVLPIDTISISGLILGYEPLDSTLSKLGITAPPFTKKRAALLYQTKISGTYTKDQILPLYDEIGETAYIFCNLNTNIGWQHKSKNAIPSARKEAPIAERLKFSNTSVTNGPAFLPRLLEEMVPDFSDDLPTAFASLRIMNSYLINELEFPANRKQLSSAEVRLQTKRKGTIVRTLQIDEKEFSREHAFTA
ncbi:MAG: hypothetical protein ACFFDP_11360 [Promethearchaeota archaeon]